MAPDAPTPGNASVIQVAYLNLPVIMGLFMTSDCFPGAGAGADDSQWDEDGLSGT